VGKKIIKEKDINLSKQEFENERDDCIKMSSLIVLSSRRCHKIIRTLTLITEEKKEGEGRPDVGIIVIAMLSTRCVPFYY
jgi:hypothetical protein